MFPGGNEGKCPNVPKSKPFGRWVLPTNKRLVSVKLAKDFLVSEMKL